MNVMFSMFSAKFLLSSQGEFCGVVSNHPVVITHLSKLYRLHDTIFLCLLLGLAQINPPFKAEGRDVKVVHAFY